MDVIYKYPDCGDLHRGFARVKCKGCHHEYLLPFSCKKRNFRPSCHQKRVMEFGEQLHEEVLEKTSHRQWVFSMPKRLRPYFMYDRKLLAKVVYKGKTSGVDETFTALDWLARLVTHIPGKGEQTVRYYGYYSNKSRGMKKKENTDDNSKSEFVAVESGSLFLIDFP